MRRRLSRHPKENPLQAKTPSPVGVQRPVRRQVNFFNVLEVLP